MILKNDSPSISHKLSFEEEFKTIWLLTISWLINNILNNFMIDKTINMLPLSSDMVDD